MVFCLSLLLASCSRPFVEGTSASIFSPKKVSFPKTSVDYSSRQILEIWNQGETGASSISMKIEGADFSYAGGVYPGVGGTCSDQIGAFNRSCRIAVMFSPTTIGTKNGHIDIVFHNGTSKSTQTIELTGVALPQGLLDTSYGVNGSSVQSFGNNEYIKFLSETNNGKLLFLGQSDGGFLGDQEILMGRLLGDGALDVSFGVNGSLLIDSGASLDDTINDASVNPDGTIIAAGNINANAALFKIHSNGSLDATFGNPNPGVKAFISFTLLSTDALYGAWEIDDSKYIAYGETNPALSDSDFVVIRTTANGDKDVLGLPLFGDILTPGQKVIDFGGDDRAQTGLVLENGKIFVAGYTGNAASRNSAFALLLDNGDLDGGFGIGGLISSDMCGENNLDEITSVKQTNTGAYIMAGHCIRAGSGRDIFVAKRNPDGSPDLSFNGGTGVRIIDVAGNDDTVSNILIANNQIIITGHSDSGIDTDFLIIRLEAGGSFDTSFGANGIVVNDISGNDESYSSLLQSDGKIILGGGTQSNAKPASTRNFP